MSYAAEKALSNENIYMLIVVFRLMMLCGLVAGYQHFKRNYLQVEVLTLKMEVILSCKSC
jgi:hypothetical protein